MDRITLSLLESHIYTVVEALEFKAEDEAERALAAGADGQPDWSDEDAYTDVLREITKQTGIC